MKNLFKILISLIILITFMYTFFIMEESIRLSNDTNSKPLIIISQTKNTYQDTYKSIGFKLINKYGKDEKENLFCIGQEFWLWNKFMLWGWIS